MFGSLVQKLQSLSPLTSPTTSPTTSPKPKRKFGFGKPARRRKDSSWWKEETREVQSEPELDYESPRKEKRKSSAPPLGVAGGAFSHRMTQRLRSNPDEPYPSHSHLDAIYDVPARIRRRAADAQMPKIPHRRIEFSRTVGRVEGMKEAERLREYDQYFASLLVDTHPDHPGYSDLTRSHERLRQLVNHQEDDYGELERIQELFPNDNLKLFEKDPVSQKMKGLIRKRSTTAARLQRAFSAKGLRTAENNNNNNNNNNNSNDPPYSSRQDNCNGDVHGSRSKDGKLKRQFIMETPVQFTTGVQSQERHLFLFTDLLLVAKARSGGNFKLKEKVRVSEMWLANCLDDVTEVSKCSDTSFVLGWPTTNVVVSYSCVATKDLWYNKLSQVITEEREKEPPSTTIQVTHYDPLSNTDICKTVSISSATTARECVSLVLNHLELPVSDESKFQLWVKSPTEEAPYPLIGHELPFAIRMNCLREILQECDAEQCGNLYNTDIIGRCQFILRQERKPSQTGITESPEGKKVSKKAKKSPIRIHRVFKRSNSKGDVTDGAVQTPSSGVLFGLPLHKICDPDGTPPKPIMDLLHQLFQKGPFTVGIFRKSANARLVRELKEKLDNGQEIVDINSVQITSVAALLKDFLRSLPDCLLCADLYEEWLELPRLPDTRERESRTLLLCSRIPRPHLNMLQFFLCVLHHIANRAAENMMSASNLAVCVGPSILWPASPILALSQEASKEAPATVEFLIDRCCNVFGKEILTLLGEPPEQDPLRLDSGAEESDSLHSLHSGHSMHSSGGMRRDDSSIDSLEREFIGDGELSPLPRKDKMSLTNLSRDSGLTMSDSQLYTPDEEESGSTSSSHSGGEKNYQNQQDRPTERFQHYAAPNNPNAIYTAVYRRPEKPQQNQFDEPDGYYAAPSREHTRVQITYSSPSYNNFDTQSPQKEYSPVHHDRHNGNGYQTEEEDAIYSVPSNISSQHVLPFVASSNFQRHDWMRRCSNLRKVSKTNSGDGSLVRSTSEESLLNKYNALEYGMSLGAAVTTNQDQINYYTTRVLPPTPKEYDDSNGKDKVTIGGRDSPLRRSKSAHQIIDGKNCRLVPAVDSSTPSRSTGKDGSKWHRSRSTPHIHEEGDRSYDSSTLSDDDSTPHVSRSNSRGKEYGTGSLHAWDSSDSHNSRDSSFKSERTGSMCTVVSAGSTSTLSSNPPSYEEALNRRSLMHSKAQQSLQCSGNNGTSIPDYAIREEKMKSARAKQLYEESLRIYQEENAYPCDLVRASPAHAHDSDDPERPPPLPPKSDPPPLPPKQKSSRKLNDGGSSRLKHLPPVHVETVGRKARSVTTVPTSQISYDPPLHKTIIYTDDNPPTLPPKERTVIEVESSYNSGVEKKSIETQTDECDLLDDDVKDEGIQTSGSWITDSSPHVTSVSVTVPDNTFRESPRRGRPRRKNSCSQRSRSMPGRESNGRSRGSDCEDDDDDDDEDEWNLYEIPSREYGGNSYGLRDLKQLDPDLQQEISWSVSQLRAIFGDTLKGAKVHPPPYRPPPNHRSPITSYHLSAGDSYIGRKQRPHSNYGEESYV